MMFSHKTSIRTTCSDTVDTIRCHKRGVQTLRRTNQNQTAVGPSSASHALLQRSHRECKSSRDFSLQPSPRFNTITKSPVIDDMVRNSRRKVSAEQTATLSIQHVVKLHELPLDVKSDRGLQFVSPFWRQTSDCFPLRS
jgi:hypothetical protein